MALLCPNCEKETRVLIPVKSEIAEGTTIDSFWCLDCIQNEDEEV